MQSSLISSPSQLASTPKPPYYAVIFTSLRTEDEAGYLETAARMLKLAADQPGFLGVESARDSLGITVSYWTSLEAIRLWRDHAEHQIAREQGRTDWYQAFRVRIARVEREYGGPGRDLGDSIA